MYVAWSLIFLLICAVIDLREQKVYSPFCIVNAVAALIVHTVIKDAGWINILLGMVMGAVIFLAAICSNESIGKGDGIVIITLGSILGMRMSFQICAWAAILCLVVSVTGILFRKLNLKSKIPFVPFLLAGAVISLTMNGG